MYKEQKYNYSLVGDTVKKQSDSTDRQSRKVSLLGHKHESINGLHLISASMQLILGLCVVALSLVNMIEPLWLSTVMVVFGSITTMVGCYFLYDVIAPSTSSDTLVHQAVKRVVNSQN